MNTQVLVDANAATKAVIKAIADLNHKGLGNNDVVLVYISTHGYFDNQQFYLKGKDFSSVAGPQTSIVFRTQLLEPLTKMGCKQHRA